MVDDFYGDIPPQASRFSSYVYQLSQWSNLMAVSGSSVLRYKILQEMSAVNVMYPLTNSKFDINLGMGFHTGMMVWIMLYNFVNDVVSGCNNYHIGKVDYLEDTVKKKNVKYIHSISGDQNLGNSSAGVEVFLILTHDFS